MLETIKYPLYVGTGPLRFYVSFRCFLQLYPKVIMSLHASLFPGNTYALLAYYHDTLPFWRAVHFNITCLLVERNMCGQHNLVFMRYRSFGIYSHILIVLLKPSRFLMNRYL